MITTQNKSTPLQEWANAHKPDEKLFFKDGYWDQIVFVRDDIPSIFAKSYEEFNAIGENIRIISTHTSKSVCLPVFKAELTDGTTFVMRDNFHDWKVSVSSPRDVEADFMDLFDPNTPVNKFCCEGFPDDQIYGPYTKNKRQFTIELSSGTHYIFTFFWIFAHKVLNKQ